MDIKDLYVKIPINHTLNITNKLLKNNQVDKHTTKDIMSILKMITNQNYFQYEGKYYKPTTGVAMGSPIRPRIKQAKTPSGRQKDCIL
jgi:hypothetical protein